MRLVETGQIRTRLWQAIGLVVPYAMVAVARHLDCLYLLQLERYKPERYCRWLSLHWRRVLPLREIGLQILVVLAAAAAAAMRLHWLVAYLIWLGIGHLILARRVSLQVSQQLQYTARAIQIGRAHV